MIEIALFQPEIAGNVGTIIRTCACFGVRLHVLEPCGFPFDMRRIKQSALDYIEHVEIVRHNSFDEFFAAEISAKNRRLILASTKGSESYREFKFDANDIIIFGQESAGVPDFVAQKADAKIFIPMKNNMRSLNLAISCAIILAHAVSFAGSDLTFNS